MNKIEVEVISVIHHFKSNIDDNYNGLYKIKLNGESATIFRNGDSWGVLYHSIGESVMKCIGFVRPDRIEAIEKAINSFLLTDTITTNLKALDFGDTYKKGNNEYTRVHDGFNYRFKKEGIKEPLECFIPLSEIDSVK